MIRLEKLLRHLVDSIAAQAVTRSPEGALVVTSLDLDLPIEARISEGGSLLATLPRGELATGFQLPVGRLQVRCREDVS